MPGMIFLKIVQVLPSGVLCLNALPYCAKSLNICATLLMFCLSDNVGIHKRFEFANERACTTSISRPSGSQ
jgi:hypothetical protein